MKKHPACQINLYAVCAGLLLLTGLAALPCAGETAGMHTPGTAALTEALTRAEVLRLGEDMYRKGVLPSGEPMQSFVSHDIPVSGTTFTCISCHMRSGMGSLEGTVVTTPTNGKSLYQPRPLPGTEGRTLPGMTGSNTTPPPPRPAYTDESLAAVIRGGTDPTGRILDPVMPRYLLQDTDMAILTAYLKELSSVFSPGVDEKTLRFATIITDEISSGTYNVMPAPVESYFTKVNYQMKTMGKLTGKARMLEKMRNTKKIIYRNLALSRWILTGPPETWRTQLEEYYRREPVFALIGGVTTKTWAPVHQFSEDKQIPCLLPQTDFPQISESDWYTLYFSKGYYQEGEAAARYINSRKDLSADRTVLQIVRDTPEGRALASGFLETWRELGQQTPETLTLKPGERAAGDALATVLAEKKPFAVILWDKAGVLPVLEALATNKGRPELVVVSSGYMGKESLALPEPVRSFTFITYPFRLPQDEERFEQYVDPWIKELNLEREDRFMAKKTYTTTLILAQALIEIQDNFYRDYFLDVISMMRDLDSPLYERMSFGPGQRYGSKGCYIVQLTGGTHPKLVKKSDWVIH